MVVPWSEEPVSLCTSTLPPVRGTNVGYQQQRKTAAPNVQAVASKHVTVSAGNPAVILHLDSDLSVSRIETRPDADRAAMYPVGSRLESNRKALPTRAVIAHASFSPSTCMVAGRSSAATTLSVTPSAAAWDEIRRAWK